MAVVDSLEVEIQAKAKQANKEIDVLCSKLGNLSKQLASVDSKGLTKFSSGLNMLSAGMKGMRDTKMPDFTRSKGHTLWIGSPHKRTWRVYRRGLRWSNKRKQYRFIL